MSLPKPIPLPGQTLSPDKMPGHWLLARLGKRVLRPGGLQLTRRIGKGKKKMYQSGGQKVYQFRDLNLVVKKSEETAVGNLL